jgi:hypothetical protein
MDRTDLETKSMPELLELTQTNVTPDHAEALAIADYAYHKAAASDAVSKGTAARQAMIRAEQAGADFDTVSDWLSKSRAALSSSDPAIERERIATELLNGRVQALRIERLGSAAVSGTLDDAKQSFAYGENLLQTQHEKGKSWDRFGTMLARHRATFEAMNGKAGFAAATALRGMWRAIRSAKEGTPEARLSFMAKQLGMNAVAGMLAVSKPAASITPVARFRHRAALKMLG